MAHTYQARQRASVPLRHSLGGRILFGFLIMALISVFLAVAGIFYTNQSGSQLSDLIERDQAVTNDVLNMELALERQASSVRGYLLLYQNQAPTKAELAEARKSYEVASKTLMSRLSVAKLDRAAFEQVQTLYTEFQSSIEEVLGIDRNDFFLAPVARWEQIGQYQKNNLITTR